MTSKLWLAAGCLSLLAACSGSTGSGTSSSTTQASTSSATSSTAATSSTGHPSSSGSTPASSASSSSSGSGSRSSSGSASHTSTASATSSSSSSSGVFSYGGGSSGAALVGVCAPCAHNGDCVSNLCDTTAGVCQTATCTGSEAYQCETLASGTCLANGSCHCAPIQPLCGPCGQNDDCYSGLCAQPPDGGPGQCQMTDCQADAGACLNSNGICQGDGSCNCSPPTGLCTTCSTNAQCRSGLCNTAAGVCQTTVCAVDAGSDCAAFGGACASDGSCACTPGTGLCGGCSQNSDCASGLCDPNTTVCQTTTCSANPASCQAGGGICASDGSCNCTPPVGLCTACSQNSDCQSGLCDPTASVCQMTACQADAGACLAANGICATDGSCNCTPPVGLCKPCSQNSDCQSGLCDPTAAVCQTTTCSSDAASCAAGGGACASDGTCECTLLCNLCFSDSDCATGFCDPNTAFCNTATCSTDPRPCTATGGACATDGSDACTCLLPLCYFCTANSQCVSGICGMLPTDGGSGVCETTTCVDGGNTAACTSFGGACGSGGSCDCNPPQDVCGQCSDNSGCLSGLCDVANQVCQVSDCADGGSSNACLANGYTCNTFDNGCNCHIARICEFCSAPDDCGVGLACDPTSGLCQTQTCGESPLFESQCANNGGVCQYPDGGAEPDGGGVVGAPGPCSCSPPFVPAHRTAPHLRRPHAAAGAATPAPVSTSGWWDALRRLWK
jgi:hypothetical protein